MKELVETFKNGFDACNTSSDLYIQKATDFFPGRGMPKKPIYTSPRVGLFLTKGREGVSLDVQLDYAFRPYRFISAPKKVYKGRHLLVSSLHLRGENAKSIADLISDNHTSLNDIKAMIAALEEGAKKCDPEDYKERRLEDHEVLKVIGSYLLRR